MGCPQMERMMPKTPTRYGLWRKGNTGRKAKRLFKPYAFTRPFLAIGFAHVHMTGDMELRAVRRRK